MAHSSLLAFRMCSVGLRRVLTSPVIASACDVHSVALSTFRLHSRQTYHSDHALCEQKTLAFRYEQNEYCIASNCGINYRNSLPVSWSKNEQTSILTGSKYLTISPAMIAADRRLCLDEYVKDNCRGLNRIADYYCSYRCVMQRREYGTDQNRAQGSAEHGKLMSDNVVSGPETFWQSILHTISNLRRDKILTVPNVLTLSRMLMSPVLGYLVLQEHYHMACTVFVIAGITDVLDGYIARNYANQNSELGSFIDPLADKFLVSILFVSLSAVNLIPVALTALVLTRDVCLTTAGFYVRYISLDPRPTSLRQFFDLTNRSAALQPTTISKANTAIQLSLVAITLGAPVFGYIGHPALQALWYLTASTTLISGIGYIFAKDTFKLLQQSRKKQ